MKKVPFIYIGALLYICITTISSVELSGLCPVQSTELSAERLSPSCIKATHSSVNVPADCAALCYNHDVGQCTHFMIDEAGTCHLSNYCQSRVFDEANKATIYDLIRPNEKHYLTSGETLGSGATHVSIVWSPSHRFKLSYLNGAVGLVSMSDGSTTMAILAKKLILTSHDLYIMRKIGTVKQNYSWVSFDADDAPYTLHLTDYGQLVLKNKYDNIAWVHTGVDAPYDIDAAQWQRACAQFSGFGLEGQSSAEGAKLALTIGITVVGLAGPVGGAFAAGGAVALNVWNYMEKDNTNKIFEDLFTCVVEYVDFRFEQLAEQAEVEAFNDYTGYLAKLMEEWDQVPATQSQFELLSKDSVSGSAWTFSGLHVLQETIVDTYLDILLPSITTTLNVRMYYWAKLMKDAGCTDRYQLSAWIKSNKVCPANPYYGALLSFRNHNGESMQHYIDAMPRVYAEILRRQETATQDRHDLIDSIFADSVFCVWVKRTYYMAQSITFDGTKACTDDGFYVFQDSYVFDPDGSDFSAYVIDGTTYDFTQSYDDCKSKLYSLISAQFTDANFQYNLKAEFGISSYKMSTSLYQSNDESYSRCLKQSDAYGDKNFAISMLDCGDVSDDNFVYGVKVISFDPDSRSDEFDDNFQRAFPPVKEIETAYCRKSSANSDTSVKADSSCNNCRLEFFSVNKWGDCYGGDQSGALKESVIQCPSGHVATGIQYYRGYLKEDSYDDDVVYLLWKIRLQCRNIQDYNVIWTFNSFTTADGGYEPDSDDADNLGGKLYYVGWAPAFECPPNQAIWRIKADDGWHNVGSSSNKGVKTNWAMSIQCKAIPKVSEPAGVVPLVDNHIDNRYKYEGYGIDNRYRYKDEEYDVDDRYKYEGYHMDRYRNNVYSLSYVEYALAVVGLLAIVFCLVITFVWVVTFCTKPSYSYEMIQKYDSNL